MDSPLAQEGVNHNSALHYPSDIDAYLQEEIKFGAILGPFDTPPMPNMHHSPFMTREKPGAPHRRVIIDLSYPRGRSINAGVAKDIYLGTPFILTFPTIDTVTSDVRKWGSGCQIYKLDISRAFRRVKLDPIHYNLLGLRDTYCEDTCLPFGYRNGSATFLCLSDAICYIITQRNYDVINHIDDIIGDGLPSVTSKAYIELQELMCHFGFDLMYSQRTPVLTRMLVVYISKCVIASRFFLNRMLNVLRQMGDENNIALTIDFFQGLNWFQTFVITFNGTVFVDYRPIRAAVELDPAWQI